MSGFSFRRRDREGPDDESDAPGRDEPAESGPRTIDQITDQIGDYSAGASDEPEADHVFAAAPPPRPPSTGVGTRIEAIVAAAQEAAGQILQDAETEAARMHDEASAVRTDADRAVAEADERAKSAREAAHEHAAKTQREAEEQAAAIIAGAEERARSLQSEAAKDRQAVAKQTARWQENIRQLATMCRGLADDLETLGESLDDAVPPGFGTQNSDREPPAALPRTSVSVDTARTAKTVGR